MGHLNGAAPQPLRLLDTTMSGYVLALAIAAVFPALRLALDRALLTVLPSVHQYLAPAVFLRAAYAYNKGLPSIMSCLIAALGASQDVFYLQGHKLLVEQSHW